MKTMIYTYLTIFSVLTIFLIYFSYRMFEKIKLVISTDPDFDKFYLKTFAMGFIGAYLILFFMAKEILTVIK